MSSAWFRAVADACRSTREPGNRKSCGPGDSRRYPRSARSYTLGPEWPDGAFGEGPLVLAETKRVSERIEAWPRLSVGAPPFYVVAAVAVLGAIWIVTLAPRFGPDFWWHVLVGK